MSAAHEELGRCGQGGTNHVDHEGNSFAGVLGISVAGAEVEEVGASSMGNGLAQAGLARPGSPIQQH